jgi:hypothetical protein
VYKLAAAIRFKPGMPGDDARRYWLDVHGPMTEAVEPVLVYTQNHVVGKAAFDGYASQWFTDRATCEATVATAQWNEVVEDGAVFQDTGWTMAAAVEEHVVVDGPRAPVKAATLGTLRDGLTPAAWREAAAPLPNVVRHVQNVAIASTVHGGRDGAFDVLTELYFESEAAYLATTRTAGWRAAEASFAPGRAWHAIVAEHVVKDQGLPG